MKETEIAINDWIEHSGFQFQVQLIGEGAVYIEYRPAMAANGEEYTEAHAICEDDCTPIKLTKDILLNNGFMDHVGYVSYPTTTSAFRLDKFEDDDNGDIFFIKIGNRATLESDTCTSYSIC